MNIIQYDTGNIKQKGMIERLLKGEKIFFAHPNDRKQEVWRNAVPYDLEKLEQELIGLPVHVWTPYFQTENYNLTGIYRGVQNIMNAERHAGAPVSHYLLAKNWCTPIYQYWRIEPYLPYYLLPVNMPAAVIQHITESLGDDYTIKQVNVLPAERWGINISQCPRVEGSILRLDVQEINAGEITTEKLPSETEDGQKMRWRSITASFEEYAFPQIPEEVTSSIEQAKIKYQHDKQLYP